MQTSTQVPVGQRKIYSDEFRTNALQQLASGQSLYTVALELGIAAATLLRWKRQAEGVIGPTKEHFDREFKARALQKLDKDQSLRQVASAMGVSIPSLVQWKRQRRATDQQATSSFSGPDVHREPHYTDRFNGVAHQVLDTGQPLGLVTATSGVMGETRPRWKHQADAPDFLTAPLVTAGPDYTDEDKAKALGLLKSGQSISQVAVLLTIPNVLIRRWWLQDRAADRSEQLVDGRRLYDDAFKAEALRQINRGVSVRQLAKAMGVTQVTLHKWRKKSPFLTEEVTTDTLAETVVADESTGWAETGHEEPGGDRIAQLEQQLRKVEQERDTLKKAIQILMRAS